MVGADGAFTAELEFPAPGLYHTYADAVPKGLGQQVMRFDLRVGEATDTPADKPVGEDVSGGPLVSSDGPYTVTLDASRLQVGAESMVSLLIEKDGAPANDLEPYLGVAAHAVFIRAEDLAYVHAHAMEAGEGQGHEGHGADGGDAALAAKPGGHGGDAGSAVSDHDNGATPAQEAGHSGHDAAATHQGDPGAQDAAPAHRSRPMLPL